MTDTPERLRERAKAIELAFFKPDRIEHLEKRPSLVELIATAMHEIEQAAEQRAWQPIETAPKMQTILLFAIVDQQTGNWKVATGFWHTGYEGRETTSPWCWDGHQVRSYEPQPTHWQPLPAPPATTAEPAKGA